MNPISHGYHVVEHHLLRGDADQQDDSNSDSVVVQREQIEQNELWYFGIFDSMSGEDKVTKFMQSHFFAKNIKGVIWSFHPLKIYLLEKERELDAEF